jgi:hypothetical protein
MASSSYTRMIVGDIDTVWLARRIDQDLLADLVMKGDIDMGTDEEVIASWVENEFDYGDDDEDQEHIPQPPPESGPPDGQGV